MLIGMNVSAVTFFAGSGVIMDMHDGKIINVDGVYHWSGVDLIFIQTVRVN
jgi:hypothetical protein